MPRMKMTPLVKTSLLVLRIYLLVLLTLILVSFVRVLKSGISETAPARSQPKPATRPSTTTMPAEGKGAARPQS